MDDTFAMFLLGTCGLQWLAAGECSGAMGLKSEHQRCWAPSLKWTLVYLLLQICRYEQCQCDILQGFKGSRLLEQSKGYDKLIGFRVHKTKFTSLQVCCSGLVAAISTTNCRHMHLVSNCADTAWNLGCTPFGMTCL